MKFRRQLILGILCLSGYGNALAVTQIVGHVTIVEPSYLPGTITFQMDTGSSACPAGSWLYWINSNVDNVKGVYATLLSAVTSGHQVSVYFNDGDTSCYAQHIWLWSN